MPAVTAGHQAWELGHAGVWYIDIYRCDADRTNCLGFEHECRLCVLQKWCVFRVSHTLITKLWLSPDSGPEQHIFNMSLMDMMNGSMSIMDPSMPPPPPPMMAEVHHGGMTFYCDGVPITDASGNWIGHVWWVLEMSVQGHASARKEWDMFQTDLCPKPLSPLRLSMTVVFGQEKLQDGDEHRKALIWTNQRLWSCTFTWCTSHSPASWKQCSSVPIRKLASVNWFIQ